MILFQPYSVEFVIASILGSPRRGRDGVITSIGLGIGKMAREVFMPIRLEGA